MNETTSSTEETLAPEETAAEPGTAEAKRDAAPEPKAAAKGSGIDAMLNVGLDVQIVLGRAKMPIAQLLKLSRGSIIELDQGDRPAGRGGDQRPAGGARRSGQAGR